MKVRYGIVQTRRGQGGQQLLEPAKRPGSLERLLCGFDRIVRARILNEAISAPIVAFLIHMPGEPVPRRNEPEHPPD